jgi:hypothetical protein
MEDHPSGPEINQFWKDEQTAGGADKLDVRRRHRTSAISYLRDRIEDKDWDAVIESARVLRKLDCELRCLEEPRER